MLLSFVRCLVVLMAFVSGVCSSISKLRPRVAIVGAGIGGSTAAYFLSELYDGDGSFIDVYEPGRIGGRLSTMAIGDSEYEVGGAVIHPKNKHMVYLTEKFGLKKRKEGLGDSSGFYDGSSFVFTQGNSFLWNTAKLLLRYGFQPIRLSSEIQQMLQDFDRIYRLQSAGYAYTTVNDLLSAMSNSFIKETKLSTRESLVMEGFSEKLINELVYATLRVNYGQSLNAHKFVGSVSLAGAEEGLWAVEGGNKLVAEKALAESGATLVPSRVTSIRAAKSGEYILSSYSSSERDALWVEGKETVRPVPESNVDQKTYDIVILAIPVTPKTQLKFVDFPSSFQFPEPYHRTVCTMVKGEVNKTTFGFNSDSSVLDFIVAINESVYFNSLSSVFDVYGRRTTTPSRVWKVFSQKPLTSDEMDALFSKQEEIKVADWLAYPHYQSDQPLGNFQLSKNLYHINGIEWAASAMEMSTIGAKNVALLAYNSWSNVSPNKVKVDVNDEL